MWKCSSQFHPRNGPPLRELVSWPLRICTPVSAIKPWQNLYFHYHNWNYEAHTTNHDCMKIHCDAHWLGIHIPGRSVIGGEFACFRNDCCWNRDRFWKKTVLSALANKLNMGFINKACNMVCFCLWGLVYSWRSKRQPFVGADWRGSPTKIYTGEVVHSREELNQIGMITIGH